MQVLLSQKYTSTLMNTADHCKLLFSVKTGIFRWSGNHNLRATVGSGEGWLEAERPALEGIWGGSWRGLSYCRGLEKESREEVLREAWPGADRKPAQVWMWEWWEGAWCPGFVPQCLSTAGALKMCWLLRGAALWVQEWAHLNDTNLRSHSSWETIHLAWSQHLACFKHFKKTAFLASALSHCSTRIVSC